jgi:hypothetical protein
MWQLKLKHARFTAQCERGKLRVLHAASTARVASSEHDQLAPSASTRRSRSPRRCGDGRRRDAAGPRLTPVRTRGSKTIKSKWVKQARPLRDHQRALGEPSSTARVDLQLRATARRCMKVVDQRRRARSTAWSSCGSSNDDKTRAYKGEMLG